MSSTYTPLREAWVECHLKTSVFSKRWEISSLRNGKVIHKWWAEIHQYIQGGWVRLPSEISNQYRSVLGLCCVMSHILLGCPTFWGALSLSAPGLPDPEVLLYLLFLVRRAEAEEKVAFKNQEIAQLCPVVFAAQSLVLVNDWWCSLRMPGAQ